MDWLLRMNNVLVVILSFAKDKSYQDMTQNTINTLHEADQNYSFDVIVVETNQDDNIRYDRSGIIKPSESFNYSKFNNIGIKALLDKNENFEYVILSNNDIIFHQNWFNNIKYAMEVHGLDSASPRTINWDRHNNTPEIDFGWNIGGQFSGWLTVYRKQALLDIYPFPEEFLFWQEDDYRAYRGKQEGHAHALIRSSNITHLLNKSHGLFPENEKNKYLSGNLMDQVIRKQKDNG